MTLLGATGGRIRMGLDSVLLRRNGRIKRAD